MWISDIVFLGTLNMNTGVRWRLSLKYVPLNQIDMLRVRCLFTPEPSEPCRQFQCNLYQIDLFIATRCFFLLYLKVFYAQTWFHLAPTLVTTSIFSNSTVVKKQFITLRFSPWHRRTITILIRSRLKWLITFAEQFHRVIFYIMN